MTILAARHIKTFAEYLAEIGVIDEASLGQYVEDLEAEYAAFPDANPADIDAAIAILTPASEISNVGLTRGTLLTWIKKELESGNCEQLLANSQKLFADLVATGQVIEALPQAGVIPVERREKWVNRVVLIEGDRVLWHAKRLRGFGSSEIGTMVQGLRDPAQYFHFSSPRDVVAAKLMIDAPDGGSGDTRRGTAMEDVIRDMFRKQCRGFGRDDIMEAMSRVIIGDHPWMVGNPDDVVQVGSSIFLTDYKCPRASTLERYQEDGSVNFDYACQLHHLSLIMMETPYPQIDDRLLVSLDFNNWTLDIAKIDWDEELANDILKAGDMYWNEYVLKGLLPPIPERNDFDITELPTEVVGLIKDCAKELSLVEGIARVAKDLSGNLKTRIQTVMSSYKLGNKKLSVAAVNITADPVYQHDNIRRLLDRNGFEVSNYDQENEEHIKLALEALKDCGEDLTTCVSEDISVAITRARKGKQFDYLEACKIRGGALLREARNDVPQIDVPQENNANQHPEFEVTGEKPAKAAPVKRKM